MPTSGACPRRAVLLGAGAAALVAAARAVRVADRPAVQVRPITRGPKFHWFAYYGKLQVDPSGRYALGMEVGFEHRSPRADDVIRVGMVDLRDGDRWILNDTYPDKDRKQTLYLYCVESGERVDLGRFDSPKEYAGEWRCDLHPRFTPNGRSVIIDSPHGGGGRQMYVVDIAGIVGG